jgi:2-amino-4-hydroxy-6-hydroxymethyldihydropteridine diphosphokinase
LIGGNLGERVYNLHQCCFLIEEAIGVIIKKSLVYETAAWGIIEQPAFLNQVLFVSTSLSAPDLLKTILQIEERMGRKRLIKMGPRIIDIDILFYNDKIISSANLQIPHPEIANRRFVLEPLSEIASSLVHPLLKKTIADLLRSCADKLKVTIYGNT